MKRRKAKWSGHILCRNYLPKHFTGGKIKGKIEVTRRRGRSRNMTSRKRQDRGKWKEEALFRTVWRTCFGRVVWQSKEWLTYLPILFQNPFLILFRYMPSHPIPHYIILSSTYILISKYLHLQICQIKLYSNPLFYLPISQSLVMPGHLL